MAGASTSLRVIVPWARGALGKIRGTLTELARDPGKMTLLFGGAYVAFGTWIHYLESGNIDLVRGARLIR